MRLVHIRDDLSPIVFFHFQYFALNGILDGKFRFRPMTLPDRYIEHGTQVGWSVLPHLTSGKLITCSEYTLQAEQAWEAGLSASQIASVCMKALGVSHAEAVL